MSNSKCQVFCIMCHVTSVLCSIVGHVTSVLFSIVCHVTSVLCSIVGHVTSVPFCIVCHVTSVTLSIFVMHFKDNIIFLCKVKCAAISMSSLDVFASFVTLFGEYYQ